MSVCGGEASEHVCLEWATRLFDPCSWNLTQRHLPTPKVHSPSSTTCHQPRSGSLKMGSQGCTAQMVHFCENFIIQKLQRSVPTKEVGCVSSDKVPDLTQMSDSRCFPMHGSLVVKAENWWGLSGFSKILVRTRFCCKLDHCCTLGLCSLG